MCDAKVWGSTGFHRYPCSRAGTQERGERLLLCRQHAKQFDKWEAECESGGMEMAEFHWRVKPERTEHER